jgi:hypothetical protein
MTILPQRQEQDDVNEPGRPCLATIRDNDNRLIVANGRRRLLDWGGRVVVGA